MTYAPPVPPRVQTLQLSWRPALRFFEERTQLLRDLEVLGLLQAFQWEESRVSARLADHQYIVLGPTGATLQVMSHKADHQAVSQALRATLLRIDPKDVTLNWVDLRLLLPVDMEGAEAQKLTANRLFPDLSPSAVGDDWAALVDGHSAELGASFQMQFGFVRPEEMPPRLTAITSFQVGDGPTLATHLQIDLEDLPACGAFFGWIWSFKEPLGSGDVSERVMQRWTAAADESQRTSSRIVNGLVPAVPAEKVERQG